MALTGLLTLQRAVQENVQQNTGSDGKDVLVGAGGADLLIAGADHDNIINKGNGMDSRTHGIEFADGTSLGSAQSTTCHRMRRNTPKYIAHYPIPMPGYCQFGLQTSLNQASSRGTPHNTHRTTHQGAHHA